MQKKAGRRITEKIITCLWCPNTFNCEHKKIKVDNTKWKQWVPLRQYCNTPNCNKKAINFRSILARKLLNPKDESEFNTAQYCLWKMIARSPIQFLHPILIENFEQARPIHEKDLVEELEILVN